MSDLFMMHADICKTFSNPKRLEIINLLRDMAELTASQLLDKIDISKANLSQHMSILIQKGVVRPRREGINIFYKLSDDRITKACDIMREVLISKLKNDAKILTSENIK
jgi:DNA-binding transcriptional ArsR family regulator